MDLASEMLLTEIDLETKGDAFFPKWNESEWKETARKQKKDSLEDINYDFVKYERKLNA